jgi:hypothetical protein
MANAQEQWQIERFSLGRNLQRGFTQGDRYALNESKNLRINEDGELVIRKGSKFLFSFPQTRKIERIDVVDIAGVRTFITSELDTNVDPQRYVFSYQTFPRGSGAYQADYGRYARDPITIPKSSLGWRWAVYRDRVYLCSRDIQAVEIEGNLSKLSMGNFRWRWKHDNPPTGRLEDWGVDSLEDILEQNSALFRPEIRATKTEGSPKRREIPKRVNALGEPIARTSLEWLIEEKRTAAQYKEASVGQTSGLPAGEYFYYITYLRDGIGDTLAESAPYELRVKISEGEVQEGKNKVIIENIPTHPDSTVTTVRIYRNVGPAQPEVRVLTEFKNGEKNSYIDVGQEIALEDTLAYNFPPPRADGVVFHNQRMWVFAQTRAGLVAYWSEKGEPENFRITTNFVVLSGSGSSRFMGAMGVGTQSDLEEFAGALIVFTPTDVFAILGDPPDIQVKPVTNVVGCQAEKTVCGYENMVFWFGANGMYATTGTSIARISVPIDPDFEGVPANILSNGVAAVYRNRLYLVQTDKYGKRRCHVFNLIRKIWESADEYPIDITDLSVYKDKDGTEMLFASTSDGAVFQLDVGDHDEDSSGNRVKIEWKMRLNPNFFSNRTQRKRFNTVFLTRKGIGNIEMNTYVDGVFRSKRICEGISAHKWDEDEDFVWDGGAKWVSSSVFRQHRKNLPVENQGQAIEVEFVGSDSAELMTMGMLFIRQEVR